MFTIAVCDDDMQERMQEVQIVKNIFSHGIISKDSEPIYFLKSFFTHTLYS